jgi:hypothetical protein
MLFAHANQPVVCSNHQQAVVWATGKKSENGGTEILLVTGQVGEGDDFGTAFANFFPRQLSCNKLAQYRMPLLKFKGCNGMVWNYWNLRPDDFCLCDMRSDHGQ